MQAQFETQISGFLIIKILFPLFCLAVAIEIIYYFTFFLLDIFRKKQKSSITLAPVSVIICARNEAHNLLQNLPAICNQKYAEFEVILVDDHSSDESIKIVQSFQAKYNHLKLVVATDYGLQGKRNALLTGVKHAKYDFLLFTDADCRVASKEWIALMTNPLAGDFDIVAGVSPVVHHHSLINKWARWDNAQVYRLYSSFIAMGLPFMATGRNMAIKKAVFLKAVQNKKFNASLSGDDDLLVNSYNNNSKIEVVSQTASYTFTNYPSNFIKWFKQKSRHVGSAIHYKPLPAFLLALFHASNLLVYIFLTLLLISGVKTPVVLLIFVVRLLFLIFLLSLPFKRLGSKDLIMWIPIFDGISFVIKLLLIPYLWFVKRKTWR